MEMFEAMFAPTASTRILDIGGTPHFWLAMGGRGDVTLVNIDVAPDDESLPANLRYVVGDGTQLTYPDKSFDICFSNSAIEHVHTWERQQAFAAEMRRVGVGVWV